MEYLDLERNLEYVLQSFGCARKEQLVRFFSDRASREQILRKINELIFDHKVQYTEEGDYYSYHGSVKMSFIPREKFLDSLWVLVNFYSRTLLSFSVLPYPRQYVFSTIEGDIYDVSVITDESDASLVKIAIENSNIEGEADMVNHIAVVYDIELGKRLGKYGFNNYVFFDDEQHLPHYEALCNENIVVMEDSEL